MKTAYLLGITVSEFQAWYHSGELRLGCQRLVGVPLDGTGHPVLDDLRRDELLVSLPYVDVEQDYDVLIALVALDCPPGLPGAPRSGVPAQRNVSYLPIACLLELFPLTQRALTLLRTRLDSYSIRLAQPIFETAVEDLWSEWIHRRALQGATALPRLVAGRPCTPSNRLLDEASAARRLMDHPSSPPVPAPGLLARVFSYDRHQPIMEEDLGFVIDFGAASKDLFSSDLRLDAILNALREFCRDKGRARQPLHEILSSRELSQILGECHSLAACPVRVETLILFLKWKYRAQRAGKVVVDDLRATARQCADRLPDSVLDEALWLFGFYCGFDQIANQLYAQTPERYRFIEGAVPQKTADSGGVVSPPSPPPPVRLPGVPPVLPPSQSETPPIQPPPVQLPGVETTPPVQLPPPQSAPPPAPKKKRTSPRKRPPKSPSANTSIP